MSVSAGTYKAKGQEAGGEKRSAAQRFYCSRTASLLAGAEKPPGAARRQGSKENIFILHLLSFLSVTPVSEGNDSPGPRQKKTQRNRRKKNLFWVFVQQHMIKKNIFEVGQIAV